MRCHVIWQVRNVKEWVSEKPQRHLNSNTYTPLYWTCHKSSRFHWIFKLIDFDCDPGLWCVVYGHFVKRRKWKMRWIKFNTHVHTLTSSTIDIWHHIKGSKDTFHSLISRIERNRISAWIQLKSRAAANGRRVEKKLNCQQQQQQQAKKKRIHVKRESPYNNVMWLRYIGAFLSSIYFSLCSPLARALLTHIDNHKSNKS